MAHRIPSGVQAESLISAVWSTSYNSLVGLTFEWDESKEAVNRVKHCVSFQEASEAFWDPFSLTIPDPDHSLEEERFILLGF
jgi:hypothetical protein